MDFIGVLNIVQGKKTTYSFSVLTGIALRE